MPTRNGRDATLPLIPEHLRPYLITPAAYLEQHKSENVAHLVVGTVVIGNVSRKRTQACSKSFFPCSPSRDEGDEPSFLPLASPLSAFSTSSPPLQQDRVFTPSPPSPASSVSSSPPLSSGHSSPPPKRSENGKAVAITSVLASEHQLYSPPSPPSRINHRQYSSMPRKEPLQQPQKVLLVQRSRHDYGGLCWEIPGGSCDPHDVSILDAAARELEEEAGLRVRRFVAVVDRQRHEWIDRGEIWRKLTFIVEAEDDHTFADGDEYRGEQESKNIALPKVKLDPEEHEDFVWATREDLMVGGMGERTFTWIQDEQRQVILRALDIIEGVES